ncbi:MAG TPA: thioredoxin domain-containing protein [Longimicrobiales bacterium]
MAAQKRTGAGSNLRTFYIVLALLAIGGLAALGYAVLGGGSPATEPVELVGVEDPRALYEMAKPEVMGDPNTPVKIVEFGDYQCPGCRGFATRIKPVLKARYVDTGKAHLVYYDYPLTEIHPHAFLAARAARCAADQGKFWEYHDLVFSRQASWAYSRSAPVDEFESYAEELGLDRGEFASCLESDTHRDLVTANRRLGEELRVMATPTIIINNRRVPDVGDLEAIIQMIEESIQEDGA